MPRPAPIALVLDETAATVEHQHGREAWWLYATEVLDHLRLPYDVTSTGALDLLDTGTAVLIFARPPQLDPTGVAVVTAWTERGGTILACGGPGDLAGLVGIFAAGPVVDGHVEIAGDAVAAPPDVPLRAFGGVELAGDAAAAKTLAAWLRDDGSTSPAITRREVGRGTVVVCGVDVWQSIVRIQQGFPIERDGEPAPDGSCPVDDGILKCDDGMPLSYERDRALPPGEPGVGDRPFPHEYPPPAAAPIFHRPHADLWRRVVFGLILDGAAHGRTVLPWLSYWPAGVPAVAHMSHDSDGNVSEYAATALEVFDEIDVRVTWCHCYPGGYDPEIVQEIGRRGHEQALHYNAMGDADIASWGWPQVRAQYAWVQALTGKDRIVSNKNHYTRWEGWHEFFSWCERLGIEIDESRGPSKQGNVGFTFGSCHLWFPLSDASEGNRRLDVLELPLHTQDLAWAGHEANRDVILDQALAEHGVAHFLFHSTHLHLRPLTRRACVRVAAEARRRGMQWWTAEQLNSWERARRGVRLSVTENADDTIRVTVDAATELAGAAILLSVPDMEGGPRYTLVGGEGSTAVVERHGRAFLQIGADLPVGESTFTLLAQ